MPTASQDVERRLHRYLEGFGISSEPHRDALVARLLAAAANDPALGGRAPAERVLEAAESELADWFARVLDEAAPEDQPPLLLGRAAFRLCDGGRRWPGVLLSDKPPPDFIEAMRASVPAPTPPEQQGAMVEQAFESWSLRDLAPARVARAMIAGNGREAVAS